MEKTLPYLNQDALGGLPEPKKDVGGAAGRDDILAGGGQVQDAANGVLLLELVAPDQPARVRVQGRHNISRRGGWSSFSRGVAYLPYLWVNPN